MTNGVPPNWDWVTARAKCSTVAMYELLRDGALLNIAARNGLTVADANRFEFRDRQPRGFTVWDTKGQARRNAEVDLDFDANVIKVTVNIGPTPSTFTATVTLNDAGQCKLRVDDDELDPWHVLKRALETLFFDRA